MVRPARIWSNARIMYIMYIILTLKLNRNTWSLPAIHQQYSRSKHLQTQSQILKALQLPTLSDTRVYISTKITVEQAPTYLLFKQIVVLFNHPSGSNFRLYSALFRRRNLMQSESSLAIVRLLEFDETPGWKDVKCVNGDFRVLISMKFQSAEIVQFWLDFH